MPSDKEFKTVSEQIVLLKSRNLIITNTASAEKHLLNKSYFNLINGFETLLLDDPKKKPKNYSNKYFEDFLTLYEFDRQFSSLIFKTISELENKLKSSIVNHFCNANCKSLGDNDNYIDISKYVTPNKPLQYKKYFKVHKIFKKDYHYVGNFNGLFSGKVTYMKNNKTELSGCFKGRFGSTSLNIINGSFEFNNARQPKLFKFLKSLTTVSNNLTNVKINFNDGRIIGLNYIEHCKTKFTFIDEFNNPPFWAVIKTLMFNDIIVLLYGLSKSTFNYVMNDFNLKPKDREKFLNSLEIIKELRNSCAHLELVNRFRTPSNLKINARLITELSLQPMRSQYVLKLYDVLKVLKQLIDVSAIYKCVWSFTYSENSKKNISRLLLERMGEKNIYYWS